MFKARSTDWVGQQNILAVQFLLQLINGYAKIVVYFLCQVFKQVLSILMEQS